MLFNLRFKIYTVDIIPISKRYTFIILLMESMYVKCLLR